MYRDTYMCNDVIAKIGDVFLQLIVEIYDFSLRVLAKIDHFFKTVNDYQNLSLFAETAENRDFL